MAREESFTMMSTRNLSILGLILLLGLVSCELPTTQLPAEIPRASAIIPSSGGSVTLEGIASVVFPAETFSEDQLVQVSATSLPDTAAVFDELASFFRAVNRLAYEVRINTGNVIPMSDSFEVEFILPDDFLATVPDGFGIGLFAQVHQTGGMDILDNFELFASEYDATSRTVRAALPSGVFTNARREDSTYEAVITLAATPAAAPDGASMLLQNESSECGAVPILCPLVGGCTVTQKYKHPDLYPNDIHLGVDLRAANETQVLAAADGKVEVIAIEGHRPLTEEALATAGDTGFI